jgi:hypothetical protein
MQVEGQKKKKENRSRIRKCRAACLFLNESFLNGRVNRNISMKKFVSQERSLRLGIESRANRLIGNYNFTGFYRCGYAAK